MEVLVVLICPGLIFGAGFLRGQIVDCKKVSVFWGDFFALYADRLFWNCLDFISIN